jgi:hypothetical protein
VTAALTVAILLAASLLIATGTRGDDARGSLNVNPAVVQVTRFRGEYGTLPPPSQ